ncbi:MAG: hypothetical protein EAZ71_09575 [Verrucomicrobia bacterium]|nr:MAG: hypothetical protein EAZ82_09350 [Verrucomicrobiota bacterium]TAF24738.1 MAG: hypothetical protein EAZ71_09575 [Verrucomicrobiota bacterium]
MRAEAADLAGATAFEVPAFASGPEGDFAGFAHDFGPEGEAFLVRAVRNEFADFGPQFVAGLQAILVEALLPELVVEEGMDVG